MLSLVDAAKPVVEIADSDPNGELQIVARVTGRPGLKCSLAPFFCVGSELSLAAKPWLASWDMVEGRK